MRWILSIFLSDEHLVWNGSSERDIGLLSFIDQLQLEPRIWCCRCTLHPSERLLITVFTLESIPSQSLLGKPASVNEPPQVESQAAKKIVVDRKKLIKEKLQPNNDAPLSERRYLPKYSCTHSVPTLISQREHRGHRATSTWWGRSILNLDLLLSLRKHDKRVGVH